MFNLKKLAISQTADMEVRDAAGEIQRDEAGNPLTITLYGPGSKQYQKAKHAAEQRHNERVMARMQGGDEKISYETKISEQAEFLAGCTVSFNGSEVEGKAGFEMFKAAYADIEIGHLAEDANKFITSRANFLKQPPKV